MITDTGAFFALLVLLGVPVLIARKDAIRSTLIAQHESLLEQERVPALLRTCTLYMNEELLSAQRPWPMRGRVDQVFRAPSDLLILLDTKTRSHHRVYASDIKQLSCYGYMLLQSRPGVKVSRKAYVRTVVITPDGQRSVRYHLVLIHPNLLY